MYQRRSFNMTMLSVFDAPVMDTNCTKRNSSAVVLQSLALLNDAFMLDQAGYFAERVAQAAGSDPARRLDLAYRIALGRKPSPKEVEWSLDTLHQVTDRYRGEQTAPDQASQKALAALCHTLLNTNEFLYVE